MLLTGLLCGAQLKWKFSVTGPGVVLVTMALSVYLGLISLGDFINLEFCLPFNERLMTGFDTSCSGYCCLFFWLCIMSSSRISLLFYMHPPGTKRIIINN